MNLHRLLPVALGVACASCASKPLAYEVIGLPPVVEARQEVVFKVRVRNTSRNVQSLKPEEEVMASTSLRFLPLAVHESMRRGELVSGDHAINRNVVNFCPPQFVQLAPGASLDYHYKWKPSSRDEGEGVLLIEQLPFVRDIPPQPVTVAR